MNLKDFFNSKRKMAIHCKTQEEADRLCAKFMEMGETWCSGKSYINTNWDYFKEDTLYFNCNTYDNIKNVGVTYGVSIFSLEYFDEFKTVDRFAERKYHYTFNERDFDIDEVNTYLSRVLEREFFKKNTKLATDKQSHNLVANAFEWLLKELRLSDVLDTDNLIEEYYDDIRVEVEE